MFKFIRIVYFHNLEFETFQSFRQTSELRQTLHPSALNVIYKEISASALCGMEDSKSSVTADKLIS